MAVEIEHRKRWRSPIWDESIPDREAWLVTCPLHPELGRDKRGERWGYASEGTARGVRTRHINRVHGGQDKP